MFELEVTFDNFWGYMTDEEHVKVWSPLFFTFAPVETFNHTLIWLN